MDQQPRIISEQVFGSSKKIQLIGMSPMDTLLNAVNCVNDIHLTGPSSHSRDTPRSMSIKSLLDSDYPKPTFEPEKRRWVTNEAQERSAKIRRVLASPQQQQQRPMTTMTCFHAAVAQKSYGSEKRFLCPPPIVSIKGEPGSHPLVSMAVVCENGDRFLEQKILLDDEKSGSFKYLHVTGTAKAKQFHLRVSLSHGSTNTSVSPSVSPSAKAMSPPPPSQPYVTFYSRPVSIISKPSKKTSKARNVSSCITANSAVSLFNRINSQTVRTKYMTTENGQLCAKNATWTPFDVVVVRQPSNTTPCMDDLTSPAGAPVSYGSEIILKDSQTGISSPPMIIRKVDKGNIAPAACGPVSQMQKIALQLASSTEPVYLSAKASEDTTTAATWLEFGSSKLTADNQEQVDDYLCWTIVGIAKFEYSYIEPPTNEWAPTTMTPSTATKSPPPLMEANEQPHLIKQAQLSPPPSPPRRIMPLPLIDNVVYQPSKHTIELIGQHIKPFEFWLGSEGPLMQIPGEYRQQVQMSLPPTQDLLVAHHDVLVARQDGSRYLELPLVLKRQQDGFTFSSGKGLACDILPNGDAGQWSVIAMSSSPS